MYGKLKVPDKLPNILSDTVVSLKRRRRWRNAHGAHAYCCVKRKTNRFQPCASTKINCLWNRTVHYSLFPVCLLSPLCSGYNLRVRPTSGRILTLKPRKRSKETKVNSILVPTQRSNSRRVCSSRHKFTKENTDKSRKFHLNRKHNAVSENWSFLLWVFVGNEVNVMHKFCRRDIRFRFHTNFALVNSWTDSKLKDLKDRMWRRFLRLTAVNLVPRAYNSFGHWLKQNKTVSSYLSHKERFWMKPTNALWRQ